MIPWWPTNRIREVRYTCFHIYNETTYPPGGPRGGPPGGGPRGGL